MNTGIAALGALLLLGAAAAHAADNESRTYSNAACSDRNAKPSDCVIQDGPPRRRGQVVDTTQDQDKSKDRDGKSNDSQSGRK